MAENLGNKLNNKRNENVKLTKGDKFVMNV